jgi:hypothetical protein
VPSECIIEVRPHQNGWEAFEAAGVQPYFPEKRQAIDYATERMNFRTGEVRIYSSDGKTIEQTITIDESNRRM